MVTNGVTSTKIKMNIPMKKYHRQWDNLYMIKLTHSSKLGDVCISNEGCRSDLGRCWYLTNVASSNHSKILAHSFVLFLCDLIKVLVACKQVHVWMDKWLNLRVDVILDLETSISNLSFFAFKDKLPLKSTSL
jgi:hypothetical protein